MINSLFVFVCFISVKKGVKRQEETNDNMKQILNRINKQLWLAEDFRLKVQNNEQRQWYNGYIEALRSVKDLIKEREKNG